MAQEEGLNRGDKPQAPVSPRSPESQSPPGPPATPAQPRRTRIRWWWIGLALAVLALNYWAGSRATGDEPRLRVPYSPFFLEQVTEGNVAEITSKERRSRERSHAPRRYGDSKPTNEFKTEIPAFANTDALSRSAREQRAWSSTPSRWTRARPGGRACCSASARRSSSSSCSSSAHAPRGRRRRARSAHSAARAPAATSPPATG